MYTAIPHDVCDALEIVFGPLHHYLLAAIGTGLPACPGAYPGCQAHKNAVTGPHGMALAGPERPCVGQLSKSHTFGTPLTTAAIPCDALEIWFFFFFQ